MINIKLTRFADTPFGVFGKLRFHDSLTELFTIERRWENNSQGVSCIPTGEYVLNKRVSPKVDRIVKGRYPEAWEVTAVPGRTFIMIHPANLASELEGCIAPGTGLSTLRGEWSVSNSQLAYDIFMSEMEKRGDNPRIVINWQQLGAYT